MVYLRLLRVPSLGPLIAAMIVARFSIGINALAIVLFIQAERGSFATAGAVAGALALGTGAGAPVLGRSIDRLGNRALLPMASVHGGGLVALVVLGPTGTRAWILVATAFVTGAFVPPVSSVLRVLYPRLLRGREQLLPTVFALDAVVTDLLFVSGPLVVAVLIAVATAQVALLVSAVTVVVGTASFLALVPGWAQARRTRPTSNRLLGALSSPGIRILVATMTPFGITFGIVEVVLPAYALTEGRPELAAVLLAIWSVASAAGGFAYGIRTRRLALPDLHLVLGLAVPVLTVPLLIATSLPAMALLVIPAGLPIGPLVATRNELAGVSAPRGAATEAFTWVMTSMIGGIALGAALGGALIETGGWHAATLAAVGIGLVGAAAALVGRSTLHAAVAAGG